jgi:hypothetical protein
VKPPGPAKIRQADPLPAFSWPLRATAQQKKQKQNWNWHPEKPEQNVTRCRYFLDFFS